ncbi:MAG: MMPL family transporter [Verrucomicrobiales bacterium]|nr:MMPL family transporter [Verrucomicrobiales bacterium]
MHSLKDSLAVRMLGRLSHSVYGFRRLFFYPQILLFAACVYYTISHLEFNTSRNDLVGSDKKYHQNFLRFRKEFAGEDDLVAVVESEDMEKNRQFVERLGKKVEAQTNLFSDVFYKGDLKMMGRKALLFLPEDTLNDLQKTLREYRPFIESFARATNLNSLFRLVNQQFRSVKREQNAETESLVKAIPALTRIIEQAAASLNRPGVPPSPGVTALFNAEEKAEQEQYITFAKGRIYLVSSRPIKKGLSGHAVERLRELVLETQAEVPGVNVGITGEPVLEYDEMRQSQADSTVATVVSLILSALIFIFAYRETGRPIKAVLCLIVGLGYTLGYTTLVVGHLNILTVTFLPILIGLAIDFGVHLITRYEEELRRGASERLALEKAMVYTGMGIFTGCFTTAGAFFAMALTNFKGIQEMGIITGGGMLVCLVPMMTLLPVLLLRGRQNVLDHGHLAVDPAAGTRARIEKLWLERPGLVTAITVGLCALAPLEGRKVYFDYNLLNMQSRGLPAVVFEEKLIHSASKSVLYAAVVANSIEEANAIQTQLTNLPTVASVDSMTSFLSGDQQSKLEKIAEIKNEISSIRFPEADTELPRIQELSQTLQYTRAFLWLGAEAAGKEGEKEVAEELQALWKAAGDFRQRVAIGDQDQHARRLHRFQIALFQDIRETFAALKNQDNSSPLRVEDLPAPLRDRFIGKSGKHLLQVYPKGNVWERQDQEAFVHELRTVNPEVTGTPVQLYEYTTLLKESYETAAWYALAAIGLLVLIHFRSVSCVVLALIPVGIGSLWLVGIMGLFNVPFNPANIMTLPLVIGIGVTNGIHILNRFAEEQNPGVLAKSTGKAVLVSGLTTIAGFGSLIPAKHQGISSLGIVMVVGISTCMIAALTFLPALLTLMVRVGWRIRRPSIVNAQTTLGREEPR